MTAHAPLHREPDNGSALDAARLLSDAQDQFEASINYVDYVADRMRERWARQVGERA